MTNATQTRDQLSHDYVLLLAEAAQDGRGSLPRIIEIIDATPSAVLSAPEQALAGQMLALASQGTPPTVAQMLRAAPHTGPAYWARRSEESSVQAVVDALINLHAGETLTGHLERVTADLAAGSITAATASDRLISAAQSLTIGSNGLESLATFDATLMLEEVPRIVTPIDALNQVLGGGLPTAGNGTFSLLIGHTGMGKTTLAYQILLGNVLEGGVSVLYCGENGVRSAYEELSRLYWCRQNGRKVSKGAWLSEKYRQHRFETVQAMQAEFGDRLFITEFFGSDSIIADLTRLKHRVTGNVLAVIDNVDHLQDTTLADTRAPLHMVLDQAARRLAMAAKRLEVHVMALAQADERSKAERRAPGATDIRKSTSMPHHAGVIISIYRPPLEEAGDHDSVLAVPKNRSGTGNIIKRPNNLDTSLVNYGAGWWVGTGWGA